MIRTRQLRDGLVGLGLWCIGVGLISILGGYHSGRDVALVIAGGLIGLGVSWIERALSYD